MPVIKVEDMHCHKCVERIMKAMEEDDLDVVVSLEDKTVTVNGCEHCVEDALRVLDDLGFEGELVE